VLYSRSCTGLLPRKKRLVSGFFPSHSCRQCSCEKCPSNCPPARIHSVESLLDRISDRRFHEIRTVHCAQAEGTQETIQKFGGEQCVGILWK
jgi:hypothetical protein